MLLEVFFYRLIPNNGVVNKLQVEFNILLYIVCCGPYNKTLNLEKGRRVGNLNCIYIYTTTETSKLGNKFSF